MQLTDYLDLQAIRNLQTSYERATDLPVRICRPDGTPILPAEVGEAGTVLAGEAEAFLDAPVLLDGNVVARLRSPLNGEANDPPAREQHQRSLTVMADLAARLCVGEQQLRFRAGELATLFALTAEFSAQRDLQSLLDLVAQTVVRALRARGCTIRLLNDDRTELAIQAVANLSPEYLQKGPILLSQSRIDSEALQSRQCVYIADETTDTRVMYPKEAKAEGIVSALCAPMTYKDRPEGVIHVYMDRHYEFNWFEVSLLQSIAAQAAGAIANARLRDQADEAADLRRHMRTAAEVQRRMTPPAPKDFEGFDFGAVYVPCFELGGDFYDFIPLPGNNLAIVVCDVVGKGVRASLLMASIRASLRAHASSIYAMTTVLDRVNSDLFAVAQDSDFATLFYAVIDGKTLRMTYANAGHPSPLLFRDGQVCHLTTGGPVLGLDADQRWTHTHYDLRHGDIVLLYTDGLSECMNFADESFGRERIESAARAAIAQGFDAQAIARHVLWEMRRFAGLQTRFDDLTLVVMRVL